ncbi:HPr family phosphocarrier protein [Actomonas aquatica]|uniref:Phosphocarrier protein HPr n=1 Tax=Actomonas aquatica TaxID=2866162 RepID=A0ABZ1CDB8_9BACT|nr:HPr family phosphocarrier protein [Opitutus sp. WL0086]WRQ88290.1 HPr family phosphocarrier protein [Opitutus sp. WL0086]
METTQVRVPWKHGLVLLPAAKIARASRIFHSKVRLRFNGRMSDAQSILGLVVLCASLNAAVQIEADGEDAHEAVEAVAACFAADDSPSA